MRDSVILLLMGLLTIERAIRLVRGRQRSIRVVPRDPRSRTLGVVEKWSGTGFVLAGVLTAFAKLYDLRPALIAAALWTTGTLLFVYCAALFLEGWFRGSS